MEADYLIQDAKNVEGYFTPNWVRALSSTTRLVTHAESGLLPLDTKSTQFTDSDNRVGGVLRTY